MLHAMADMREVDILAVNYNEVHPSGIAAIDATNIWYGRRTPIRHVKGSLYNPDASGYLDALTSYRHPSPTRPPRVR